MRTSQLKNLFSKEISSYPKLTTRLDSKDFTSIVEFHMNLRRKFLNFQIISEIYYGAIIQSLYLFNVLSKIDPENDLLKTGVDQNLLKELLEFYPQNPKIFKKSWISVNFPILGQLKRTHLFQIHLRFNFQN